MEIKLLHNAFAAKSIGISFPSCMVNLEKFYNWINSNSIRFSKNQNKIFFHCKKSCVRNQVSWSNFWILRFKYIIIFFFNSVIHFNEFFFFSAFSKPANEITNEYLIFLDSQNLDSCDSLELSGYIDGLVKRTSQNPDKKIHFLLEDGYCLS